MIVLGDKQDEGYNFNSHECKTEFKKPWNNTLPRESRDTVPN